MFLIIPNPKITAKAKLAIPNTEIPFQSGLISKTINKEAPIMRATIIKAVINCFVILCSVCTIGSMPLCVKSTLT